MRAPRAFAWSSDSRIRAMLTEMIHSRKQSARNRREAVRLLTWLDDVAMGERR